MGTEARFDSVTGNKAAPCIMGTLLMCIKLGADGATGQPGNTLNSYVDNTPHSGHSISHCSHRSLELNLIQTMEIWPKCYCVWQSWESTCCTFSGCFAKSVANGKLKENLFNSCSSTNLYCFVLRQETLGRTEHVDSESYLYVCDATTRNQQPIILQTDNRVHNFD
jgi:hypothetical protein